MRLRHSDLMLSTKRLAAGEALRNRNPMRTSAATEDVEGVDADQILLEELERLDPAS